MISGWQRLSIGGLLWVGLVIHWTIAQESTTEAATTAAPQATEAVKTVENPTPNGAQDAGAVPKSQDDPKENKGFENVDYCDPSLCLKGERHVACNASTELHDRCSMDAELVTITDKLRTFITEGFNQVRASIDENDSSPLTWDPELSHLAEYNVQQCLFKTDDCINTKKYKHAGQIIGYRGLKGNIPILEDILGEIKNGWVRTWTSNSITDMINGDKSSVPAPIYSFLQIVFDNTKYVGCAVLQQAHNGWFQTFFTCNFDVAPTKDASPLTYRSKAARSLLKKPATSVRKIQGRSGIQPRDAADEGAPSNTDATKGATTAAGATTVAEATAETATQASYLDKPKLQKKFARFLNLMKNAMLKREQRKIVVITSNHEVEYTELLETTDSEGHPLKFK